MKIATQQWAPYVLSILRIMAGLLFLEHGTSKLFGFPPSGMGREIAPFTLIWFAAVLELVGGFLITVGLFTRCAAFVVSGEMAFAYFIGHAGRGFFPLVNLGEAAILYCFIFLYFAVAGGGAWSVDKLRR